ncbi:hypothetical protein GCM10007874_35700 [Labrys miyagiensis]|uniref:Uncharacterized protein n=1 Tax=Labrys miyagiensis TaxID=346912 RepID=A0ABQ6CJP9_9HYPH|nr:hypothetical protein GCM10007874_35700 [Labrys miyagiensis]
MEHFGENSDLGRPGEPVELSPVYVLLASPEASFINGEVYGVTGGNGIGYGVPHIDNGTREALRRLGELRNKRAVPDRMRGGRPR